MTKIKSVTCPNCGAVLTVDESIDSFFCMHCGQKINLSDDTIKMDIKTDHTIRWVNQAKLERERAEREERNKPMSKQDMIIGIVALVAMLIFFWIFMGASIISGWLGI